MLKYYLLNPENEFKKEAVKINSKIEKIVSRMSKLVKKHSELDKQLVKEFAKLNNIPEEEASDIMCFNDFLVDSSQYGLGELLEEISKSEYEQIKKEQQ